MTLTDLARRRYETGEYGNAHLALRREDMGRLPKADKPQGFDPSFGGGLGLAHLTGIPVVIDDDLPELRWELRDNHTKRVITAGTLLGDFARSEPS
ncbi:MAG TPA: hypothetical protein VGW74_11805 [Propionibacteriaceae bacterium]|nr:hypothetical protein [Propionibacteriaceae bacterium]